MNPFNITPDPQFTYCTSGHAEVLGALRCLIEDRAGFAVVSGEIGSGKTTLCRLLLREIEDSVSTSLILNPDLSASQLLVAIVEDFGLEVGKGSRKECFNALNRFLLEQHEQGRTALLIIDEAQQLKPRVIEQIRLLTNFESNDSKLLQVILVGQPEILTLFAKPSLVQLRQRIDTWCHLGCINQEETGAYINHRLQVADGLRVTFAPDAIATIYHSAQGVPRLINLLCDKSLKVACSQAAFVVTHDMVQMAAQSLAQVD